MKLEQRQVQRISQYQLQSIELLQMSALELEAYIQELALTNPVVEIEARDHLREDDRYKNLEDKLRWLEETDEQNRFYRHVESEERDALDGASSAGGLEETLFRFLAWQISQRIPDGDDAQAVLYLAACLDDDGYLRASLDSLARESGIPLPRIERAAGLLRGLEPAGVGAADLSQCLELQLERFHESGPALAIVRDYLEPLAKRHYRLIAAGLSLSVEEVLQAEQIIRKLEPRPGALFQHTEQVPYIHPDVFVEEAEGRFVARTQQRQRPIFHISSYYRDLFLHTKDRSVKDYLTEKLRQAESVLWAVDQRESTLQRCAQAIVDWQSEFFRYGSKALVPLRMADVGKALNVHESTISRAVREKYLQCSRGVYPLSYFFSRPAAESGAAEIGAVAARALLQELIDGEDKLHPMSDQKLSDCMARKDCPISRRTVAKYREELGIPSASGRRRREGME